MKAQMRALHFDWVEKLSYLLQTLAFCLAISAIQYAFQPDRPYELPLVYSLCIGTTTWALIDFGRHLFPSAQETGWPEGLWGVLHPVVGIVVGYILGTLAGDAWFGWSSWSEHPSARSQLLLSITVTAMAGTAGTYFFYSRQKAAFLEAQTAQAKAQATQAQLKLLQTQLDPHLLFNTLANLRALIGIDPTAALAMLDRMDAYLRATLRASRATEHSLADEFARLEDYLELMKVRMGPRLHYRLDLPAELAAVSVPTLLLQPLVENSIKHGLEPQIAGGEITVQALRVGGQLHLRVHDTGAGFDVGGVEGVGSAGDGGNFGKVSDPSDALAGGGSGNGPGGGLGFGLSQVYARMQTHYGAGFTMECVANKPQGTCLNVVIS
jgi:Histidine kinase/Histidine kinase-, DNA gyrase B-, and HSP90-like ATPase